MKIRTVVTLFCGMFTGSILTLLVTRAIEPAHETAEAVSYDHQSNAGTASSAKTADPFANTGVSSEDAEELRDPFDRSLNMQDRFERDVCISFWYLNMQGVVSTLERQTGHKFKTVAKTSTGPVEILEEQAEFMRKFLEDTEKVTFQ